jgi:NAD(P)-dependent dehydrogenase (short-subunit alcohol dehydrogenase family)
MINCLGPVLLARDVAQQMVRHEIKGAVLTVTSQHAITHPEGREAYAGAKQGLSLYTRYLARAYRDRVRFNEVCLGALGVGMSAATREQYKDSLVDVDQVIDVMLFLLSEASSHITGTCIRIDRGTTLPYV